MVYRSTLKALDKIIVMSQEKEEIHYNAGIESGIVKIEPDCSENDPDFEEIHPEEEASVSSPAPMSGHRATICDKYCKYPNQ